MVERMAWLSNFRAKVAGGGGVAASEDILGILAFEAAATMARLVSLNGSLGETEMLKLRSETMRSQGVAYLTSTDQSILLRLACAEMIDALDRAAAVVTRLGRRCNVTLLQEFERVYADLKIGAADLDKIGIDFTRKVVEKRVKKMERLITTTSKLCEEMEALEASERKLNQPWVRYSGPIAIQNPTDGDALRLELKALRHRVRRLKEESLWNQTFEKAVAPMARAVIMLFTRVCAIFAPFVPGLPTVVHLKDSPRLRFAPVAKFRVYPRGTSSGPIERRGQASDVCTRNSCPIIGGREAPRMDTNWSKVLEPPQNTVGGSGLGLRYADVVLLAEKVLIIRSEEGEEKQNRKEEAAAREELYEMLPVGISGAVRVKLRECWRDPGPIDGDLAEGWKDAVWRILGWLGPVAHDTVRWHSERNMDRRQRFELSPRTLMLQTLQFADREKTEAAIVEVLVGLSLVCWYQERHRGSVRL